jgi:SAM-dependent methyltransferase
MKISAEELRNMLETERFPKSNAYDPVWVAENQMGPNALWLSEWLCEKMVLKPGMRVLDMGCGRALSSVFLAREYGVEVWANDLWIKAGDNWERVRAAGLEDRIFPIHAEAHALPYAEDFFDAIVSLDSYHYYGTDDLYLGYITKFLEAGGQIGIVVPALMRDLDGDVPEHLTRKRGDGSAFWAEDCWTFHTLDWWRSLWGRSSLVDLEVADILEDGWRFWAQSDKAFEAAGTNIFPSEAPVLEEDGGRFMGFVRLVARRTNK